MAVTGLMHRRDILRPFRDRLASHSSPKLQTSMQVAATKVCCQRLLQHAAAECGPAGEGTLPAQRELLCMAVTGPMHRRYSLHPFGGREPLHLQHWRNLGNSGMESPYLLSASVTEMRLSSVLPSRGPLDPNCTLGASPWGCLGARLVTGFDRATLAPARAQSVQ